MLNVKLGKLVESVEQLGKLSSLKINSRTSYNLSKAIKLIDAELVHYNDLRITLIKDLGTSVEGTDQFTFEDEQAAEFNTQMSTLLDTEVELQINQFKVDELGNAELEPNTFLILDWLFVE